MPHPAMNNGRPRAEAYRAAVTWRCGASTPRSIATSMCRPLAELLTTVESGEPSSRCPTARNDLAECRCCRRAPWGYYGRLPPISSSRGGSSSDGAFLADGSTLATLLA